MVYIRRRTYKVHRGGFSLFGKKAATDADKQAHEALGDDEFLGVVISKKSLESDNPDWKARPYVVTIPERLNGGKEGHAYGSSAADAVRSAQNRKFEDRQFGDTDKGVGVLISAKRLISPHPDERAQPYVVNLGGDKDIYASSPSDITRMSFTHRLKRGASSAWQATKKASSSAYQGAKKGASSAYQGAKRVGSSAYQGTKKLGSRAAQGVSGAASAAGERFKKVTGIRGDKEIDPKVEGLCNNIEKLNDKILAMEAKNKEGLIIYDDKRIKTERDKLNNIIKEAEKRLKEMGTKEHPVENSFGRPQYTDERIDISTKRFNEVKRLVTFKFKSPRARAASPRFSGTALSAVNKAVAPAAADPPDAPAPTRTLTPEQQAQIQRQINSGVV